MTDDTRRKRPAFDEALRIVAAVTPRAPSERIDLDQALGRVAGADVVAVADYPLADMAAMDGVALAAADSLMASPETPVDLPLRGEARAGAAVPIVSTGAACRISTGAVIPTGYDAVIAREYLTIEGDTLLLTQTVAAGRNIRKRGEDAQRGDIVLPAGRVITPMIVGALACYGVTIIDAARLPAIRIISTGDELSGPNAIHDANGVMIAAMVRALGMNAPDRFSVGDDPASIRTILSHAAATPAAILISTGGVSVGDHDHIPRIVAELGGKVHFHGVTMRPGKPVMFATLPNGALYFGLPGNPVAAALGFRFLVMAAIRAMFGLPPEMGIPVAIDLPPRPDTTVVLKARHTAAGEIEILADQRSHTMRALLTADRWITVDGEGCRSYPLLPVLG
ncbi:molybdopterin molybdotransferase MoeA [Sphingomonas aliaeris]|uniref:Molybdopterin molybdenumtransferase n=1 Tax=Sphingomonas aliaeris TaxID=2759526 RepID=A0A974NVY1_9SPHN|nr:molybdopterin molybdotransferase MoeA [Sphingomonas aliaeris]QQV78049.1 molybdopterin molybdotransferase MoeA [Sphingomonas aliaeris]